MKKKIQWKDFLMLQVVFLIYSFTSLTQKLASSFLPKNAGSTQELVHQLFSLLFFCHIDEIHNDNS